MMTNPFAKFPNQPTDHFFERLGGSTLRTPASTITLDEDFSSTTGWSQQGTEIAINTGTGKLDWIGLRSSTNTGISYDFGAGVVSTSKWRLQFDLYIQNFSGTSYTQRFGWMLSTKGSADNSDQLRDFIGGRVSYRGQVPTNYQQFNIIDDQGSSDTWADNAPAQPAQGTDNGVTPVAGTTYNIVLTRDSPTAYTMTISSGGTLLDTLNYTSYAGTSDLRYLLIQRYGDSANAGSSFNGTIDNLKFYNGVTGLGNEVGIKQHFIEWFSGKQLPSYWTKSEVNPPASFAMNDSVDGGFRITADGGALNEGMINFNNKRAFSKTGSVCIWVGRDVQTSSYTGYYGLANGITGNDADMGQLATIYNASANGVIALRTGNTTKGNTESTISLDTNFHNYKIEMKTSSAEWSVDGVAQTTRTLTLPTEDLQPVAGVHGNNKSIDVRYMECYNT